MSNYIHHGMFRINKKFLLITNPKPSIYFLIKLFIIQINYLEIVIHYLTNFFYF